MLTGGGGDAGVRASPCAAGAASDGVVPVVEGPGHHPITVYTRGRPVVVPMQAQHEAGTQCHRRAVMPALAAVRPGRGRRCCLRHPATVRSGHHVAPAVVVHAADHPRATRWRPQRRRCSFEARRAGCIPHAWPGPQAAASRGDETLPRDKCMLVRFMIRLSGVEWGATRAGGARCRQPAGRVDAGAAAPPGR